MIQELPLLDHSKQLKRPLNRTNRSRARCNSDSSPSTATDLPIPLLDLPSDSAPIRSRPRWQCKRDYFFSCLGFVIGLPTIWRFPYVAYDHGGGTFLVAYIILSIFVGIPMYQLELCMGQCLQTGFLRYVTNVGVGSWKLSVGFGHIFRND